ncbi:MAG: hypothetical protein KKD07_05620 [Candidatus Omnitrophica bacterium]|nr:hypothetical protein [Candidatus Omnitrophota bacterium]
MPLKRPVLISPEINTALGQVGYSNYSAHFEWVLDLPDGISEYYLKVTEKPYINFSNNYQIVNEERVLYEKYFDKSETSVFVDGISWHFDVLQNKSLYASFRYKHPVYALQWMGKNCRYDIHAEYRSNCQYPSVNCSGGGYVPVIYNITCSETSGSAP